MFLNQKKLFLYSYFTCCTGSYNLATDSFSEVLKYSKVEIMGLMSRNKTEINLFSMSRTRRAGIKKHCEINKYLAR